MKDTSFFDVICKRDEKTEDKWLGIYQWKDLINQEQNPPNAETGESHPEVPLMGALALNWGEASLPF